ncbi:MAG: hypothetical protein HFH68_17585 [Lachnospiraceae bacterium]|nr:hypothetical protein [Lachnospiraceae bacterium]
MDGFVHITRVVKTRHEKAVSVYNFHVKDWKSYFVGKANCYVHNGIGKHPENLENINVNYSDMMYKNLKSWANDEADRLSKISKRQREKFNTASIVYDKSTGKCYYGRNNGICINNKFKNPILFGTDKKKGLLPKKSFNRYAVGNCAEVDAVNNALNVGAKLESLYMSTIHTTKSSFGCLKSACENCTYIFKGKIIENFAG